MSVKVKKILYGRKKSLYVLRYHFPHYEVIAYKILHAPHLILFYVIQCNCFETVIHSIHIFLSQCTIYTSII